MDLWKRNILKSSKVRTVESPFPVRKINSKNVSAWKIWKTFNFWIIISDFCFSHDSFNPYNNWPRLVWNESYSTLYKEFLLYRVYLPWWKEEEKKKLLFAVRGKFYSLDLILVLSSDFFLSNDYRIVEKLSEGIKTTTGQFTLLDNDSVWWYTVLEKPNVGTFFFGKFALTRFATYIFEFQGVSNSKVLSKVLIEGFFFSHFFPKQLSGCFRLETSFIAWLHQTPSK